jgi:hypothetical protein
VLQRLDPAAAAAGAAIRLKLPTAKQTTPSWRQLPDFHN